LARPSGTRSPVRRNPAVRRRARASRSSAESFRTRRRSFTTSSRSSASMRSAPSTQTTTVGAAPSQPRAVERGMAEGRRDGHVAGAWDEIPKAVVGALLRAGRSRHRHDHGPFPHAAQLLEDGGGASERRDDNSRGRVQNVREHSSAVGTTGFAMCRSKPAASARARSAFPA
jgi:hypothetical protein